MNRILLLATTVSLLSSACHASQPRSSNEATRESWVTYPGAHGKAKKARAANEAPAAAPQASAVGRNAGDFVVYRFSGSFQKQPLTLTERVLAREGTFVLLELTLEEGGKKQQLRVKMNDTPGANREVFGVTRFENGVEIPADAAAYEAMMSRTIVAADENEELLASENVEVQIGGANVPCKATTYRVRLGKHQATMRTVESDRFPWGDVGAEIAQNGKLIYKAEIVEAGHAEPPTPGAAVAASVYDE